MTLGTISRLEFTLRATALMLLAVSAGGNAITTALIGAGAVLPTVLMGPTVARVADRYGARGAALCGILANILLYAALIPVVLGASVAWVYWVFSTGFGIARPFVDNAVNILIVESSRAAAIERTNGVLSTGQSLGGIAGPSLAGTLFAWSRVLPLFAAIVCAGAALACALRIAGAVRPEHAEEKEAGSSWRLLRANRMALALSISGFLSNVFAGCYSAMIPLYLLKTVQMPPQIYGANSSIVSVGVVLANTAYLLVVARVPSWRIAAFAGALSGMAMIAMSTTHLVPLLLVCTGVYGIGLGGWNSGTSSALLRAARGPGLHGITTLYRSIVFAGAPLGSGLGALMGSLSRHGAYLRRESGQPHVPVSWQRWREVSAGRSGWSHRLLPWPTRRHTVPPPVTSRRRRASIGSWTPRAASSTSARPRTCGPA
ncbi:MFS transporter [Actinomyces ruminis]|uniref:MFS transporter n=1 Tax=Actinomyces ruminis TaxID=1937003 RepID=UPI00117809BD|nr:MFS transporter [Actinomyces ruminis]